MPEPGGATGGKPGGTAAQKPAPAKPSSGKAAAGDREQDSPSVASGGAAGTTGRPRPGYDRRVEDLPGVDATVLRGRRIAIDPGHGGRFPGSIGAQGLTEAEVNLGVALHLWGLLTEAGATVFLTRTTDRDFATFPDSSLRTDLGARVDRINAFDPDVVISIHHNADAGGRNDQNEIQTYYKFSDPDASYDLALAIHRHLKTNLGIEADRVIPGNFFVIRNARAPAVLGESSYLTNPDVEARLRLAAKQRLEAEAYFLGLVTYFRQGVPRILAVQTELGTGSAGADAGEARERPWITARVDRAPGPARLTVDGAPVDSAAIVRETAPGGAWLLRHRPAAPLTDGRHVATWAVRAAGGNWSRVASDTFDVDLPVARVELDVSPRGEASPGQIAGLTLRALDRHGRAVSDTVVARFTTRVGGTIADSLAPRTLSPGEARAYARITGGSTAAFGAQVVRPTVRPDLAQVERTVPLGATGAARVATGFAQTSDGTPVAGARISAGPRDTLGAVTNADGFYALAVSGGDTLQSIARGYVTAAARAGSGGSAAAVRLLPVAGGTLRGKKIAIDPGGGDADTSTAARTGAPTGVTARPSSNGANGGLEPGGLAPAGPGTAAADSIAPEFAGTDSLAIRRALVLEADANLRVASALREYLEAAGANVVLTRDKPESLSAVERLRRTEAFVPDRVIVIGHRRPSGATVGYYFGSTNGKALAGRIARRLEKRDVVPRAGIAETGNYVVAQTAAVAVALNGPTAEPLYAEPTRGARRLREEAYAIYLALAEDFGADPKDFETLPVSVTRAGSQAANVPVELDGRWILLTNSNGKASFDGLPKGASVTLSAGEGVGTTTAVAPASVRAAVPVKQDIALEAPVATAPAPQ
ncbi:MAG: N-acetylmuramoyl-L-alanine amidase [Candidatus Eiseniibacteriota bacterium]